MSSKSGYTVLETILVLLIVAIVGGTGWFVWHSQQASNDSLHEVAASQLAITKHVSGAPKENESTPGWRTFTSQDGVFTVRYPAGWVQPADRAACGDFLKHDLEVGPNASSVIKCGGDGTVSQVSVSDTTASEGSDAGQNLAGSGYTGYAIGKLTIDGLSGTTQQAIASGQGEGIGALPDGAKVVIDTVTKGNHAVVAQYLQYPATQHEGPSTDELKTFKDIVRTIKIN